MRLNWTIPAVLGLFLAGCFDSDNNKRSSDAYVDPTEVNGVALMSELAARDENDDPVEVNGRTITFAEGDSFDGFLDN